MRHKQNKPTKDQGLFANSDPSQFISNGFDPEHNPVHVGHSPQHFHALRLTLGIKHISPENPWLQSDVYIQPRFLCYAPHFYLLVTL